MEEVEGVKKKSVVQEIAFAVCKLSTLIIVIILGILISFITLKGVAAINWEFLTAFPRNGMTEGGIYPAIVGTFYLIVLTGAIALPLGVASAIYLTEFAKQNKMTYLIHLAINNLAGVPSIVFGLFGLAFFVKFIGFGTSLLAGSFTLAIVILPTIIRISEEAIKAVPDTFREASFGLGATKWHTIRHVVLPAALPGILTGSILGLGRAAGETAPILFTVAAYFLPRVPRSVFDATMALPYHLYVTATSGMDIAGTRHLQFGTALVLLFLVLLINSFAILIRYRSLKGRKW
jgi:phosphate transport system permease protein